MSVEKTRIYPINTGWLEADLGTYIFWKGKAGEKVWNPTLCFYVDTGEHKIMVDTGLSDEARATKYHHKCQKRGCVESPEALRRLGVDPSEIDIVLFTHLHWDHVQCMKEFKNARYICTPTELLWAHNPLPLYYRSYESPVLGIEAPFIGCHFELVEGCTEIVPGVSVFPTPGHSMGHQAVSVKTTAGDIVIAGDALFQWRNMEPNLEEKWRYWVPARFVSSVDGWKSIEELDKRADFILPCHEEGVLAHPVYPYEGMPLRQRRKPMAEASFFFGGV
jgi:N-acyl homoserine lactone hydrolase